MYRYLSIFIILFYCGPASGQIFPTEDYPRNIFRNPLNIPISLAANFGELRANHYHMGLDIRTEHRENLPVYAAADGYIYRIKIEPFGFGQAIYIRHADGYLTLYAHLNAFFPALAAWVKQKQYEMQRWDLTLDPPAGLFQVKKGEEIALSGNMGGSQGPHLHFEIRTFPEDLNLNPLLFGLPVKDDTPPVIRGLSVYDRNRSFYEQVPRFVPVRGKRSHFSLDQPDLTFHTSSPGFGISAFDTQTGSSNPNGLFQAIIYEDGKAVSGFQMNRIGYDDTRGINAHVDYPTFMVQNHYYQLMFRLPGYKPSIYKELIPGGKIHLEDGKQHDIRIELTDANGNTSNLEFRARLAVKENFKEETTVPGKIFYPDMVDGLETPDAAFFLTEKCLYDSVHLVYQELTGDEPDLVSGKHQFGNKFIPLGDTMTVRIRLKKPVKQRERILMQWKEGEDSEVKKPEWLGEWATATFRNFGTFSLVLDTLPPVIRLPGIVENANLSRVSRIAVLVRDNYKKLKIFRATLDGNWLLFSNDKARAFVYHFDEHCPAGKHELKIYTEDEAGNASSFKIHFVR